MTGPSAGWGPALAADAHGDRWAAADGHAVHVWSGEALQRTVALPGVLGGGAPRWLDDGSLVVGRFTVDPSGGGTTERLPLALIAAAHDAGADPDRMDVRAVAWSADGGHALVAAVYPPTRVLGEHDTVRPGSLLGSITLGAAEMVVLDRPFLGLDAVAAERWLCTGGTRLRALDPATGGIVASAETGDNAASLATLGDVVFAGLSSGGVVRLDVGGGELQSWARHEAVVDAIALSADGLLVATGDRDGRVAVWDVDGTAAVLETSVPGRADGVCFLGGDRLVVAVGGPDRQLRHLTLSGPR